MRKDKLPQQEGITRTPFPSSKKIYVPGRIHPQIKVAMREISLSPTKIQATGELEENPPVTVYDTSGPYTDPNVDIDINKGLEPLRQQWILDRQDVEELEGISSNYGQERLAKSDIDWLRFPNLRKPLRAKKGQECFANALRQKRNHHSRNGVYRYPRKPKKSRTNAARDRLWPTTSRT